MARRLGHALSDVRALGIAVVAGILFISPDAVPWPLMLLQQIPIYVQWPILGGAIAWLAYHLGARAGATRAAGSLAPRPEVALATITQLARSLTGYTDIQVAERSAAHEGSVVIASGVVDNVTAYGQVIVVSAKLVEDGVVPEGWLALLLEFDAAREPGVRPLQVVTSIKVWGIVSRVEANAIKLRQCELLEVGGAVRES